MHETPSRPFWKHASGDYRVIITSWATNQRAEFSRITFVIILNIHGVIYKLVIHDIIKTEVSIKEPQQVYSEKCDVCLLKDIRQYFGFQDVNLRIMFCLVFFEVVGWYSFFLPLTLSHFLSNNFLLIQIDYFFLHFTILKDNVFQCNSISLSAKSFNEMSQSCIISLHWNKQNFTNTKPERSKLRILKRKRAWKYTVAILTIMAETIIHSSLNRGMKTIVYKIETFSCWIPYVWFQITELKSRSQCRFLASRTEYLPILNLGECEVQIWNIWNLTLLWTLCGHL